MRIHINVRKEHTSDILKDDDIYKGNFLMKGRILSRGDLSKERLRG